MKLKDLLLDVCVLECTADPEMNLDSVVYDSRKATEGSLFVAVSGFATDGNRFIPMAMEKGARAVVTAVRPGENIPYILVRSDRLALAQISANFYGRPAEKLTLVGVTGTNGKTTVTLLLKQVLEKTLGAKVGLIGTMENHIGELVLPAQRTTPESLELQELFQQMVEAGCRYAVMEVSSHAIALDRVAGLHFAAAAFTNLTEDHLDFHKTMQEYCMTKAQLFSHCDKAVLNGDDSWFTAVNEACRCPVLTTSVGGNGDLIAENIELHSSGVSFHAVCGGEKIPVQLPIPGKFSVYNALTVLGITRQLGIGLAEAAAALADCQGIRGRVEVVPTGNKPYTVLIDYAHTPDGLENVLTAVRGFCKGRLITVFGCGGDRDPMKRPIMGRIGVELSDIAVITSDNPRTEAPMAIIEQILAGVSDGSGAYTVMEDRRKAIQYAMDIAQKNDIIVLAGKGHETYQEICGVKYPMDEREIVAAYLEELRN